MPNQLHHSRVSTGDSGWISIHINAQSPIDPPSAIGENPQPQMPSSSASCRLFEHAQDAPIPFPERYPRLTFLAISVALLASTLTAEFEYLRGAGYYWP